jgi:hypothetical protein
MILTRYEVADLEAFNEEHDDDLIHETVFQLIWSNLFIG